jgi:phosphoribosyl 1,2-cyclic phosphate phosphodiesterase
VRELIAGAEVLIVDGLRDKPHPTHMTVARAVEAAKVVGAKRSFITHLTHEKNHVDRQRDVLPDVDVAYDGLRFEFPLD